MSVSLSILNKSLIVHLMVPDSECIDAFHISRVYILAINKPLLKIGAEIRPLASAFCAEARVFYNIYMYKYLKNQHFYKKITIDSSKLPFLM